MSNQIIVKTKGAALPRTLTSDHILCITCFRMQFSFNFILSLLNRIIHVHHNNFCVLLELSHFLTAIPFYHTVIGLHIDFNINILNPSVCT